MCECVSECEALQQQQQQSLSQPLQRESMLGNSSLEFPWTRSRPPLPSLLPLSHSPPLLLPSHPPASPSPCWLFHLGVIWACVCVCVHDRIFPTACSTTAGLFVLFTAGRLPLTFSGVFNTTLPLSAAPRPSFH